MSRQGIYTTQKTVKPLWTVEFEDEEVFLEWVESTIPNIQDEHRARTVRNLRNRDFYCGEQHQNNNPTANRRDRQNLPPERNSKLVSNKVHEMVEQWVSKTTRFAPAIAVLPANSQEFNDKMNAKLCKNVIDFLFYNNNIEQHLEDMVRYSKIDGESFLAILWDKNKGDIDPQYQKATEKGMRIPLVDSEGNEVLSEDGEVLYIESEPKVGDVKFEVIPTRHILRQPKERYEQEEWLIRLSVCDIDEVKMDYPDMAGKINYDSAHYISEVFEVDESMNEIMVFELYHKPVKNLASGRYIKFIKGKVLENIPLPYSMKELPFIRLVDKQVPQSQFGISFIDDIIILQRAYNNVMSIGYDSMAQAGHAKWLVPKQAQVELNKLANEQSVISYAGNQKPSLEVPKTIGQEMFSLLELYDREIMRSSAIQDVSRGEIPAGIEAGVALAFLEEQENQRANSPLKRYNDFIKQVAKTALAIVGDYYKPEDERMLRIVGNNLQFSVRSLETAKLSGDYDIRVQRTTALSESKSGRLSQILALQGRFPNMLSNERVMDMLDLANDQKYYDLVTVAIKTAEFEEEEMKDGVIHVPMVTDEHILHWEVHAKELQSSSFKFDLPDEIKQIKIEHLRIHEVMMRTKATQSQAFAQRLMMLENFPMVTIAGDFEQMMNPQQQQPVDANGQPLPPEDAGINPQQGNEGDVQALQEPVDSGEQSNMEQNQPDLQQESPIF